MRLELRKGMTVAAFGSDLYVLYGPTTHDVQFVVALIDLHLRTTHAQAGVNDELLLSFWSAFIPSWTTCEPTLGMTPGALERVVEKALARHTLDAVCFGYDEAVRDVEDLRAPYEQV